MSCEVLSAATRLAVGSVYRWKCFYLDTDPKAWRVAAHRTSQLMVQYPSTPPPPLPPPSSLPHTTLIHPPPYPSPPTHTHTQPTAPPSPPWRTHTHVYRYGHHSRQSPSQLTHSPPPYTPHP